MLFITAEATVTTKNKSSLVKTVDMREASVLVELHQMLCCGIEHR